MPDRIFTSYLEQECAGLVYREYSPNGNTVARLTFEPLRRIYRIETFNPVLGVWIIVRSELHVTLALEYCEGIVAKFQGPNKR